VGGYVLCTGRKRLRIHFDVSRPLAAHQHRHIDVSYLNIGGTFYYLCSVLDGFNRFIVNWDIRESMTEADIEIILQGAKEQYPEARPRIISDNGPQFIAKDFKEFIRISGMTHVRTSPFYTIEPLGDEPLQTLPADGSDQIQKRCIEPRRFADRLGEARENLSCE
jgi:transposase InsO family protein